MSKHPMILAFVLSTTSMCLGTRDAYAQQPNPDGYLYSFCGQD